MPSPSVSFLRENWRSASTSCGHLRLEVAFLFQPTENHIHSSLLPHLGPHSGHLHPTTTTKTKTPCGNIDWGGGLARLSAENSYSKS